MYVTGDLHILAADIHCLSLNFEIALCYPFIKALLTPNMQKLLFIYLFIYCTKGSPEIDTDFDCGFFSLLD
jgi:hypothetical protein